MRRSKGTDQGVIQCYKPLNRRETNRIREHFEYGTTVGAEKPERSALSQQMWTIYIKFFWIIAEILLQNNNVVIFISSLFKQPGSRGRPGARGHRTGNDAGALHQDKVHIDSMKKKLIADQIRQRMQSKTSPPGSGRKRGRGRPPKISNDSSLPPKELDVSETFWLVDYHLP